VTYVVNVDTEDPPYGNVNQYETIGGNSLSYDGRGNLTVDQHGYQYSYDYENRITQIKDSSNNVVVDYTYDALGRRIQKDDGAVTRYYYDGQRVLLETDGSDDDQRYYVYGNYIDEVLVMKKVAAPNAGDYYFAHDHLYSVVAVFDAGGNVKERVEYDAYGSCRILDDGDDDTWFTGDDVVLDASAYGNPYLFTGRNLDSLNNGTFRIYYYRARYYDPETGRFLQRDLEKYVDSMNLYEYAVSNPNMNMDPSGRMIYFPPVTKVGEGEWIQNDCSCKKGWCYQHSGAEHYWKLSHRRKWSLTAGDYLQSLQLWALGELLERMVHGYVPIELATNPEDYVRPAIIIEEKWRLCFYHRSCQSGGAYSVRCYMTYEYSYKESDYPEDGWPYTAEAEIRLEQEKLENAAGNIPTEGRRTWHICLGNNDRDYLFPGEEDTVIEGGWELPL
jgi:RHS repeat-associated protein